MRLLKRHRHLYPLLAPLTSPFFVYSMFSPSSFIVMMDIVMIIVLWINDFLSPAKTPFTSSFSCSYLLFYFDFQVFSISKFVCIQRQTLTPHPLSLWLQVVEALPSQQGKQTSYKNVLILGKENLTAFTRV